MPDSISLDTITALAKRRGFTYQTSSIYGGLANSYDYGPLGTELLRNIKQLWWKRFIHQRSDMIGLDSTILQHPQTWVASGHVESFTDPLVEDEVDHTRYRADHLIEAWVTDHPETVTEDFIVEDLTVEQMAEFIKNHKVLSPNGNPVSEPKVFNLLFETEIGSVAGDKSKIYLRGETAQGIFANFKNILDSSRVKLPFGVGQLGKSFRNEVTTGQYVFRTLEFEQGEIEYFFDPETTSWETLMENWKSAMWDFVVKDLGINPENLRWRKHTDTERSHYSLDTYDLEYNYPFGWKELWGIAYRTDYDLQQHRSFSGADLEYTDPHTGKKIVPHVIEPAVGIGRLFLMMLIDTYREDAEKKRVYLQFPSNLAPYTAAIFPLVKNKPELVSVAEKLYKTLQDSFVVTYDDRGNIGKRYLYQDEIGTPFCITCDYQTLEDNTVTVRNRDTAQQERVLISDLNNYLAQ